MSKGMLGELALRDVSRPLGSLIEKLASDQGAHWLAGLNQFMESRWAPVGSSRLTVPLIGMSKLLSMRLGREIEVPDLPKEATAKVLKRAAQYGLQPVYVPEIDLRTLDIPGATKPSKWFLERINGEDLPETTAIVKAGWYLANFTASVDYTDGSQVWQDDPLSAIITELRQDGKIGKYDKTPIGSRYAIVPETEWSLLLGLLAERIGVEASRITLESSAMFYAIGVLYDSKRGTTNSWEWFADTYGAARLCGGYLVYGGLAYVDYYLPSYRDDSIAGRPLVSFATSV